MNALKCRTLGAPIPCGKYYNAHVCTFLAGKWPTICMAFNGGSAGSLQTSVAR